MEDHFKWLIIFIICDIIFGLNGVAIFGGAIYLIIKTTFNSLIFILMVIASIIAMISAIGFISIKKNNLIMVYLILVSLIFLFFVFLSIIFVGFSSKLIDFLKNKVNNYDEKIDKINDYKNNLCIVACIGALCSMIAFITALLYYKKLKNKKEEIKTEDSKEDVLHNIDFTQDSIDKKEIN